MWFASKWNQVDLQLIARNNRHLKPTQPILVIFFSDDYHFVKMFIDNEAPFIITNNVITSINKWSNW
jgi:hypothetical protein